jgi:hypothetical protein
VEFRQQDLFDLDLRPADAVMMYLTPWMVEALKPQLAQLRPGARVVTHRFWLEQVRPEKVAVQSDGDGPPHRIYAYVAPLVHDSTMEIGKPPQVPAASD